MPENHNEHVLLKKNMSSDDPASETAVINPKRKWTKYQKLHLVITLLLLALCIALIGIYVTELRALKKSKTTQGHASNNKDDNKAGKDSSSKGSLCQSPECIALAAEILTSADHKVDPCTNFYEYACGGWRKKAYIPDSKSAWDTFSDLREANEKLLKNTLETKKPAKNSQAENELYKLYASCVNTSAIETLGFQPLIKIIDSLGSWKSVNETWNNTDWDIAKNLANVHAYFAPIAYMETGAPLFDIRIAIDVNNSSKPIIKIGQPSNNMLHLDEKGNVQSKTGYPETMLKITKLLGGKDPEIATRSILELEKKIFKAFIPSALYRDVKKSYKKMTVQELTTATNVPGNKLDWLRYLQLATKEVGIKITNSTEIAVQPLVYLKKMTEIVSKTSKTTLANYFIWSLVMEMKDFLPKVATNLLFNIEKLTTGAETEDPRWQECLRKVESIMGMALGAIYVREKFEDKDKKEVETMIDNIKKSFLENIRETDWMDEQTKKRAAEKAEAVIGNIAYPSFLKDPVKLANYYNGISLNNRAYFENAVKLQKMQKQKNMVKIKQKVDRQEWKFPPTLINAFYDSGRNKMIFMAGILQSPFFNRIAPKPINYGGIGMVMGHELSHGFDDQGRLFDKTGSMKSWWTSKSAIAYKKREKCIRDQYSRFSLYGIHVNGNLTLGENIADNGGIKTAFKAYKTWVKNHGPPQRLPGVNMTDDQLFFMASAQIWCSKERRIYTENSLRRGTHSPDIFRVQGALSNSEEFAKAFNCPKNSVMNPEVKCSVW